MVNEMRRMKEDWVILVDGARMFDSELRSGVMSHGVRPRGVHVRLSNETVALRSLNDSSLMRAGRMGVICHMGDTRVLQTVREYDLPCVLLGDEREDIWRCSDGRRTVVFKTDDQKVGELAAEYLYGQGRFKSYVYVGDGSDEGRSCWASERHRAFAETLARLGYAGEVPEIPLFVRAPEKESAAFLEQVGKLPKPIGVFACDDRVAQEIVSYCELGRLHIPDQLALLGVDDESAVCEQASTSISSIRLDYEQMGRQAMEAMGRLLRGESVMRSVRCPPMRIVERASTQRDLSSDRFVIKAIQFIQEYPSNQLMVDEIAESSGVSRSYLESRFRRIVGRSVHAYVQEVVMDRVKLQLEQTKRTVSDIAAEFGFPGPAGLCSLFKRMFGISTTEYRRSLQGAEFN